MQSWEHFSFCGSDEETPGEAAEAEGQKLNLILLVKCTQFNFHFWEFSTEHFDSCVCAFSCI